MPPIKKDIKKSPDPDLVEGADMRGHIIPASTGRSRTTNPGSHVHALVEWFTSVVVRQEHGGKVADRFDVGNGVTAIMLPTSKT